MKTLLIANRGEIALRVMWTARRLGIRTVAIHTDLDVAAPHVRAADEVVRVESYLDIDAVVAAAQASGADAIHPGYGFLSERAAFARAVEAAGIKLVGPSSAVMEQMGRKDAAREIAVKAGVPVVPSYSLDDPTDEMRFPVLVKAAAGGGGKGMRVVREAGDFVEAVAAARREASSSFGDDTLLVEKYVERGRHIEVQVLADAHGNVVHLFERDCSTQRRHQKVLEEAPAPTIGEETRRSVTGSAVALAAEVGYENAGTVEFLLDDATGEVYFLEMNTRLQVEHPVTESVVLLTSPQQRATGAPGEPIDLVRLQLQVAAGEPLPFTQADLGLAGHAIEARVYAEDSFGGFLPQAGTTTIVRWPGLESLAGARYPATDGPVRVDAALESGQVVSTAYDPMLGKVIARGPDRESARQALVAALDETAILGLTTNVGFLRALAASAEFRDADIDTAWLDRNTVEEPSRDVARIIAAWTAAYVWTLDVTAGHPFRADGWRLGADPAPVLVELDRPVLVDRARGLVHGAVDAGDGPVQVQQFSAEQHTVVLGVDGSRHRAVANVTAHAVEVVHRGQRFVFERPDVFGDHALDVSDGAILAPMPGTVLDVRVEAGQSVAEGEVLGAMEAMKMELALKAPFAGTVTEVGAAAGDQVALGARLFVVEPDDAEEAR
jgi:3-methylcrotonyl-CoA carboxylase alpha subunit/acetyl-CoA/propionyl-CoA carboxylase biotin carboxyl carrier protein